MASRSGRQAVFFVRPPVDWKPQRPWSIPPSFTDGMLIANKQSPRDALAFARLHNQREIQKLQRSKTPIQQWAVVFRFLKPAWRDRSSQGEKGGEA